MRLSDILFPKFCLGCNKLGTYLCPGCISNIKQGELICPTCEHPSIGGSVHPLCKRRYGLDGLWSLGSYEGSLKKAIQKLKYKFVRELAQDLIDLSINYWAKYSPLFFTEISKTGVENWAIVPVPLHPKRERWRGFNQAALLGQLLSKKIGIDYREALNRVKHTKPQVGLKGSERKKNIKDAFTLTTNYQPKTKNSSILLVDDVWTTGSTLKECCYILKRGGAKKVWAITLAR